MTWGWRRLIQGSFVLRLATEDFAALGTGLAKDLSVARFGRADTADVDAGVLIEALEREGIVSNLAEPNLTALNGQPASFLACGEFPFPVPGSEGAMKIEHMEFGVSLSFLATMLSEERIAIEARSEVSDISFGSGLEFDGITVPLLTVRRAESSIEIASDQSFAIAGHIQRNVAPPPAE